MAKISLLPAAGPLTGAETMPIVQDDETKQARFSDVLAVIEAEGDVQVVRVGAVADLAVLAAASAGSLAASARRIEYERVVATWRAATYAGSNSTQSYLLNGDSTGVGVANSTGFTPRTVFLLYASTAAITSIAVAGTASQEQRATWEALAAGDKSKTLFTYTPGLNNTLPQGVYFSRTFASSDQIVTDLRAVTAAMTGGAEQYVAMCPENVSQMGGFSFSADYQFYLRRARRSYGSGGLGPNFVNTRRLMFAAAQRSGPDRYVTEVHRHTLPPSFRGDGSGNEVLANSATIQSFTASPATAGYEEGQVIFVGTGTAGGLKRLTGGAWTDLDGKHVNEFAAALAAQRMWQLDDVRRGVAGAPPVMEDWDFPVAQNVAAGTVLATIPIKTNAGAGIKVSKIELFGEGAECFNASNGGVVTRSRRGTVPRGRVLNLLARVWGTGINPPSSWSWVDAYVTEPSTDLTPRPIAIPATGCRFVGMEGHGTASSRALSLAIGLKPAVTANGTYLMAFVEGSRPSGASAVGINVYLSWDANGRPNLTIANASGAQIGRLQPKSTGFGGVVMAAGTVATLLLSIDLQNNLKTGYIVNAAGDNVLTFDGTGGSVYVRVDDDIPWAAMMPSFLGLVGPNTNEASANCFHGDFYGLWMATGYVDWSVAGNRRQHVNADGTFPSGAFRGATAGVNPLFSIVGDIPKHLFGDPGYTDAGGPSLLSYTASGMLGTYTQTGVNA